MLRIEIHPGGTRLLFELFDAAGPYSLIFIFEGFFRMLFCLTPAAIEPSSVEFTGIKI